MLSKSKIKLAVNSINVLDQGAISKLKRKHPGQGVGPLVASRIIKKIEIGEVTKLSQIPKEYGHLGIYIR
jgi:hypothetical protein